MNNLADSPFLADRSGVAGGDLDSSESGGAAGGGPPGKPGLIKTLKQAGLDNRGEVHAPLASECDTSSGRVAKGHGGSDTEATTPTQAYSHDPFIIGEVRDWLDGIIEKRRPPDSDQVLSELTGWVRRLPKGTFKEVFRALCEDGYADLWRMLFEVYRRVKDRA